jgi:heptosyltransferase-2
MKESAGALDAAGKVSVLGLAALIERCALIVTNDTAPVHVASSLGVPVFAFYGPNTPRLYGPLSRGSYAFFRALPCSPCLTNLNYKTSHCRMPVCIRDIGVDEVAERVTSRLAERRAASALGVDPRAR